jgi:hypothetical protein
MSRDWESGIVELPPRLEDMQAVLRTALGRVTSVLDLGLLSANAGLTVTGTAGALVLPGSYAALDAADAVLDQVRLVAHASTSAGTATLQLYDVTAGAVLCDVSLSGAAATQQGSWTRVAPWAIDHVVVLRVVGDGVATQTLYSVHAQFRTVRFQP